MDANFLKDHWKKLAVASFAGFVIGGMTFGGGDEGEKAPSYEDKVIFHIDNPYNTGNRYKHREDGCSLDVDFRSKMLIAEQPGIMSEFRKRMQADDTGASVADYASEVRGKVEEVKLTCQELIPPPPVSSGP